MKFLSALLFLFTAFTAPMAYAATTPCQDFQFEGQGFTACTASVTANLRLFHTDAAGQPYGSFAVLEKDLNRQDKTLGFAMNAGMYHADRTPVGLYIEGGVQKSAIADGGGYGNFGLTPNGIFCVGAAGYAVLETQAYRENPPACTYASQSGPMLVIDGKLHPKFQPNSRSRFVRNGVGVSDDGQTATFLISNSPVNFDTFARVFRDHLGLNNALYFDGKVSRLYAPALARADIGRRLGAIVGLVTPR